MQFPRSQDQILQAQAVRQIQEAEDREILQILGGRCPECGRFWPERKGSACATCLASEVMGD